MRATWVGRRIFKSIRPRHFKSLPVSEARIYNVSRRMQASPSLLHIYGWPSHRDASSCSDCVAAAMMLPSKVSSMGPPDHVVIMPPAP